MTAERQSQVWPGRTEICPRCGQSRETLWHRYYECGANAEIEDPELPQFLPRRGGVRYQRMRGFCLVNGVAIVEHVIAEMACRVDGKIDDFERWKSEY